jgi:hypothetical protein
MGQNQTEKQLVGEGDDKTPGDKGNPNGSIYATSYYGGGGSGSGKGWGLNGRKLSTLVRKFKNDESGTRS